jgi:plastocyanin
MPCMRSLFLFAAWFLALGAAPPPAPAPGLTVYVRGAGNAPIRDAVVTVHLIGRATPAPAVGRGYRVDQKDIQFQPFVLVVPRGAEVAFPNSDSVRHHVYSFSQAKRFELKLYAREQARAVRFDQAGVVALGCNIHDQMTAFIAVVDTAYAVKTDGTGNAVFANLPTGPISIEIWHPYLRAPGNRVTRTVTLGAGGTAETIALSLRAGG